MPLERYRQKRDFTRTSEPSGGPPASRPGPAGTTGAAGTRFVVQRHRATRLHYDFRLEIEGVLVSWAIPRGPSMRPLERRLAARTEDHPIEYLDFEGLIPAGEYGGGDVIVWDWGTWRTEDGTDPGTALRAGELKLELDGERLQGRFVLVRTRGRDTEAEGGDWLLIHKRDAHADPEWTIDRFPTSVMTGRTNDEVREGLEPRFRAEGPGRLPPVDLGLAEERPMPDFIAPMAATPMEAPFTRDGWLFEPKLDGYRLECVVRDGRMRTWTRNRQDAARWFPDFAAGRPTWLAADEAIVDGEIVALDEWARPDFSLLQDVSGLRGLASRRGERRPGGTGAGGGHDGPSGAGDRAADPSSLVYFAFDLLYLDGRSLLRVPLGDRKHLLRSILRPDPGVRLLPHVEREGATFHASMRTQGFEGTVAKVIASAYEPGRRSRSWLKIKARREQELVVVGYEPGRGSHAALGALLVATREGDGWRFAGEVGSGLDERTRADFRRLLDERRTEGTPVAGAPSLPGAVWSEPVEVVRVGFTEWTSDGLLRHPVFRGREIGRDPRDVRREVPLPLDAVGRTGSARRAHRADGVEGSHSPDGSTATSHLAWSVGPEELAALDALGSAGTWSVGGHDLTLTNLDKVLFPAAGLTKRDLVRYYVSVAPFLLPYLDGRPLTTHRWPDGVAGETHFWQKQIPAHAPDWVARWHDPTARPGRSHTYLLADRVATLAWLAGLAVIDIHPTTGRLPDPGRPDFALIDIDPGSRTTWDEVLALARLFRTALAHVGVRSYPKVTGQRGIQAWIPIAPRYTFDDTSDWVERLSRAVGAAVPELVSWAWGKADRHGLARLDYTQNAPMKTLVAPYAVRPVARAAVSMPIDWDELDDPDLAPDRWDIRTALERISTRGDLFRGALEKDQELPSI